jgi:hypothetical protein
MQPPLLLTSLFERAGRVFPKAEIISQRADDSTHRYTYAEFKDWNRTDSATNRSLSELSGQP